MNIEELEVLIYVILKHYQKYGMVEAVKFGRDLIYNRYEKIDGIPNEQGPE